MRAIHGGLAIPRALDAEDGVWLDIKPFSVDGVMTAPALSVATLVDSQEGVLDSLPLILLPPTQFECHLLGLHRIHSRETANRGIQPHRLCRILAGGKIRLEFRKEVLERASIRFLLGLIHDQRGYRITGETSASQ